jgi:hypothetical protein
MGRDQHPLDRALTILMGAERNFNRDQLAGLPVIQRDELLLRLREQTFGSVIDSFVQCPQCSESLEFSLSVDNIRTAIKSEKSDNGANTSDEPLEVVSEDIKICFRLPDSRDIAAAVECEDLQAACHLIVRRCIREVHTAGDPMDIDKLPDHALDAAAAQIASHQQQAEVLLEFQCPACKHNQQMIFDVASFLWSEIAVEAKRLLEEVHILASAYGWREADILSLSPLRRQYYLEAVL